jgi:hypothetical protein
MWNLATPQEPIYASTTANDSPMFPPVFSDPVIGSVGSDSNGDSLRQFVTFYKVDASAASGKGDWVIDEQQGYGPAP